MNLTRLDAQVLLQHADGLLRAEEDCLGQRQEQLAVRSESDLPALAAEEQGSQLDLQLPHLIAQGGLRDPQEVCSLGETQGLGYGDVVSQLGQFHKAIL